MGSLAYSLRPAKAEEWPLVFNSWIKTYCEYGQYAKLHDKDSLAKWLHGTIEAILHRGQLTIAASPDEATAYGYMAHEGSCIHFIFVKSLWRKLGISTALLATKGDLNRQQYSFKTSMVRRPWLDKHPGLRYNPLAALIPPKGETRGATTTSVEVVKA